MLNFQELEDNGIIRFDISHRGGYYTMPASDALELLNFQDEGGELLDNLPNSIGCGCNYLGGGIRGAVYGSSEFEAHGVPSRYARKLEKLVASMIARYIQLEGAMNNEIDDDGEENWDAQATASARHAGVISAY